jgi:hypothetical protein
VFGLPVTEALNCCDPPAATFTDIGKIETETCGGGDADTPRLVEPLTVCKVPVIVTEPTLSDVARPDDAIVAIVVSEELHVVEPVTSFVELSLNVAVALNC